MLLSSTQRLPRKANICFSELSKSAYQNSAILQTNSVIKLVPCETKKVNAVLGGRVVRMLKEKIKDQLT